MPYFLVIGIGCTLFARRQLRGLLRIPFHAKWLLFASLLAQLVLNVDHHLPSLVQTYGTETFFGMTIVSLLINYRISGMPLIALGALMNLIEIAANHGAMPILSSIIAHTPYAHSHLGNRHVVLTAPHLALLSDRLYIRPFIMSLGDMVVGAGLIQFILSNSSKPEGIYHDERDVAT